MSQVTGLKEGEGGVLEPLFKPRPGPALHTLQLGTFTHICDLPTLPDPYETRMVEVRQSNIPGGGEGLFTRYKTFILTLK